MMTCEEVGGVGGTEGKGLAVAHYEGRLNARFDGAITDEISFPGRLQPVR